MLGCSFNWKKLQMKKPKHQQLPPQIHVETPTVDKQIKPLHYLVKHETVFPSQKYDWHTVLADFRKGQFSIGVFEERDNIIIKALDSLSFKAVKRLQCQHKKPTIKITKTILQKSASLNDTDITDNDDPIEKKIPQNVAPFSFDLSLIKNPFTSEKYNDSEIESLQPQTIHEIYPSIINQSVIISFFCPSFFKYTFFFWLF